MPWRKEKAQAIDADSLDKSESNYAHKRRLVLNQCDGRENKGDHIKITKPGDFHSSSVILIKIRENLLLKIAF